MIIIPLPFSNQAVIKMFHCLFIVLKITGLTSSQTSKPSFFPLKIHTPEIELLLSSPKIIIDPNPTLRKPSILCNIPPTRLQLMKIFVNSSVYLYSQNQIEQFSLSKCFQKYGMASVIVSLFEYSRLNASKSNVLEIIKNIYSYCLYLHQF